MTRRPSIALGGLFPLALLLAGGPALAQERVANGARFGEWTVLCEAVAVGETTCYLAQQIVRLDTNVPLAALLVVPAAEGEGQFLSVRIPQPVWLAAAMALRLPGQETDLALVWQTCSAQQCEALIPLSAEQITTLDVAEPALVGYRAAPGEEALVFQTSFAGLAEGLAALSR